MQSNSDLPVPDIAPMPGLAGHPALVRAETVSNQLRALGHLPEPAPIPDIHSEEAGWTDPFPINLDDLPVSTRSPHGLPGGVVDLPPDAQPQEEVFGPRLVQELTPPMTVRVVARSTGHTAVYNDDATGTLGALVEARAEVLNTFEAKVQLEIAPLAGFSHVWPVFRFRRTSG